MQMSHAYTGGGQAAEQPNVCLFEAEIVSVCVVIISLYIV